MPAILRIELERVGALIIPNVRDSGVNNAEDQRRLACRSKVEFSGSTSGSIDIDMVQGKSVRYRAHQLLEKCHRTTFLHPVLPLSRRDLPASVHRFGEIFFPLVNTILLLLPLPLKAFTQIAIALVLLVLGRKELLECSLATFWLGSRIHMRNFPVSILPNGAQVELDLAHFSLDDIQPLQVTRFGITSVL